MPASRNKDGMTRNTGRRGGFVCREGSEARRIAKHLVPAAFLLLLTILGSPRHAAAQGNVEEQIRTCFENARKAEQQGEFTRAESEYRHALGMALTRIGNTAARLGDYPTAERAFDECLRAVSVSEAGLMGLGLTSLRSGQYQKGIDAAQKLLDFDPFNAEARRLLGKIYLVQKKYADAVQALKDANEIREDAGATFALALAYMNLGRLDEVRKLFDRIPALAGDTPQLHVLFGRAYREVKKVDLALEEFGKALALDPQMPRVHYYMGLAYLSTSVEPDLNQALREFLKELESNPDEYPSQYFVGAIYARQRQFEEAARYLNRATELMPMHFKAHHTLALVLSATDKAEEAAGELRKALELAGDKVEEWEKANMQYQLGQTLRKAGRMEEAQRELTVAQEMKVRLLEKDREKLANAALETIEQAAARDVELPEEAGLELVESPLESFEKEQLKEAQPALANLAATAYNGLALLYASKPDIAKAASHFRLAAQWDETVPDVWYNLGLAYFRQQKVAEAIPVLEKALERDPGKIETRRLLGAASFMNQDYARAAELLASVVGDAPAKDPQTSYSLALALARTNRVDEALKIVDALIAAAPGMAELHVLKGQILGQRGEYAPAIQSFDKALALKPNMPEVSFFAGMAYLRQSEFDLATQRFERELKRDPNHIQAKYHIAFIAATRNEKEKAVPLLQEVIRMNPNHGEALYQLGKIQLEQGQVAPAVANLETAANLEPQQAYIFYQLFRAYSKAGRAEDAQLALKRYQALKGRSPSEP